MSFGDKVEFCNQRVRRLVYADPRNRSCSKFLDLMLSSYSGCDDYIYFEAQKSHSIIHRRSRFLRNNFEHFIVCNLPFAYVNIDIMHDNNAKYIDYVADCFHLC